MKILKYFFYALLVVFILFLGTGFLFPETEYEAKINVQADPQACWEVFTDSTRMAEWVSNFESIKPLETSDEMVGNTYLITVTEGGETYEMTELILAYEPGIKFSMELESDVLMNIIDYEFSLEGTATQITASNRVKGKGVLMKAIIPFMRSLFQSQLQKDLSKLKAIIEG